MDEGVLVSYLFCHPIVRILTLKKEIICVVCHFPRALILLLTIFSDKFSITAAVLHPFLYRLTMFL